MLEKLIEDIPTTYGPLGLIIVILIVANIAQWRRGMKLQDDYFEQSVQTTAALVELNILVRNRGKST